MSENIIFEWEVPADHPNFTGHDDIAEAYRVLENEKASGGYVIHARYGRTWIVNPWSVRPLVGHLLRLIKQLSMGLKKELVDKWISGEKTPAKDLGEPLEDLVLTSGNPDPIEIEATINYDYPDWISPEKKKRFHLSTICIIDFKEKNNLSINGLNTDDKEVLINEFKKVIQVLEETS